MEYRVFYGLLVVACLTMGTSNFIANNNYGNHFISVVLVTAVLSRGSRWGCLLLYWQWFMRRSKFQQKS